MGTAMTRKACRDEEPQYGGHYCKKTTRGGYYNKELARYHGRAPAPPMTRVS